MNNMRTEYKLLLCLGIIFFIILIFTTIKYDVFNNKIDELKSKKYINCTEEILTKGIEYTNHYCSITDDSGYNGVISYPSLNLKTKDASILNNRLSREFTEVKNKIDLIKAGDKFYLNEIISLDYQIYHHNNIVSILILKESVEEEYSINYQVYNIDVETGKFINDEDMKNKLKITYDLSSDIRMEVIKMYALKYHYDYIGKLGYLREPLFDESVESVTYNNISHLYTDDDGNIKFIFMLYNPDYKRKIPYYFTIDKYNNIKYDIKN